MKRCEVLVLFTALLCGAFGLDLPADFKVCKRTDPDINNCLQEAIEDALPKLEKGLPDFGVGPIQPLSIPSMSIGEGAGAVHVVQNYKNVNIYGISDAKIKDAHATINETSFVLKFNAFVADLKLEADYKFDGRILVLPIVGDGKCKLQLKDLKAELILIGEVIEKKGTKYLNIKEFKLALDPGKVEFHFENLFNGDERLGKEMNALLNDNWKEVFADVKSGYEDSLAIVLQNVCNLIFKKVSYEKILPL